MNNDMSLLDLLEVLKKRIGLISIFCVLGLLLFSFLTFMVVTPKYKSTSQLLVTQSRTEAAVSQIDISTNLQLINTYKDIIKGPIILEEVISAIDSNMTIGELSDQVEVLSQENSQVFSIVVTDEDAQQAALLANLIAETFQTNIWDIMNIDNVVIISEAVPNGIPSSPNVLLNLVVGFIISLMMGVGTVALLEVLDNTIKTEEFINNELGWSTLGEVIEYKEKELDIEIEKIYINNRQKEPRVKSRV